METREKKMRERKRERDRISIQRFRKTAKATVNTRAEADTVRHTHKDIGEKAQS